MSHAIDEWLAKCISQQFIKYIKSNLQVNVNFLKDLLQDAGVDQILNKDLDFSVYYKGSYACISGSVDIFSINVTQNKITLHEKVVEVCKNK